VSSAGSLSFEKERIAKFHFAPQDSKKFHLESYRYGVIDFVAAVSGEDGWCDGLPADGFFTCAAVGEEHIGSRHYLFVVGK
jgi:hypothetical protein